MSSADTMNDEFEIDEALLRGRVRYEQLAGLIASSRTTIFPALALGVAVLFVFWKLVDRGLLMGWFAVLAFAYVSRLLLADLFAADATPDVGRYERWMVAVSAATGLSWGLVGWLPLPAHGIEYEAFLGFLVSGVVASAIPSLGMHRRVAFAFVIPCVLPLGLRMLVHVNTVVIVMGAMVLLYLLVLYVTVQRNNQRVTLQMRERIESGMRRTALAESRSELQRQRRVMDVIARVQSQYIAGADERVLFGNLLGELLQLTGAAVGMIVSACKEDPALQGLVQARRPEIALDVPALPRSLFEKIQREAGGGARTLSQQTTAELCAIERWPAQIAAVCAVPLYQGEEWVGVTLIAHGPDDPPLAIDWVQPLATTLAQLMIAMRAERRRRETEQRLDRVRAQLVTCITDTPASVAMLDRQLQVVAHSQQFVRDFGAGEQVLVGRSLYDAVPEIPQRWRESFARVLEGDVENVDEDPFIRKGGVVCWLRWQARPWYEPGGGVGGVALFTADVTQQKKASDALNARERLLEQLTDRVPGVLFQMRVRANGERSLLYVSSGSLQTLRAPADKLMENAERLFDACMAEDRAPLEEAMVKGARSGVLRHHFRKQLANGEIRYLRVQADATHLADGSALWHGYIEDITSRPATGIGSLLGPSRGTDATLSPTGAANADVVIEGNVT